MTGAPEKAQYVLRFDITGQSIDSKPFLDRQQKENPVMLGSRESQ